MDFILQIFISSAIPVFGISYIFGFLDKLNKIEYIIDLKFFETAIEYTNDLRFIPRQLMLSCLYFSMLSYYSGVWTIKILRFLILK